MTARGRVRLIAFHRLILNNFMETTKYGQTFYQAEADAMFSAGCKCGNNGGGDCDWCRVYYNGPEYEGHATEKTNGSN